MTPDGVTRGRMTPEGVTTLACRHGAGATAGRLVAAIEARGLQLFLRLDHAAGARAAGLCLRATEVFVFGNPRAGTKLMQASQVAGLDLPLRALVWEDEAGLTWLSYTDPNAIAARHGVDTAVAPSVAAMSAAVAEVARDAADQTGP